MNPTYQALLESLAKLLTARIEMRQLELKRFMRYRADAIACGHSTTTENEKLALKRLASLNKQIASLGSALSNIGSAAQSELEHQ